MTPLILPGQFCETAATNHSAGVPATGTPAHVPLVMTEREVAALLQMKVSTLRAWRLRGKGPAFLKLGAAVRYRREDVEAFMDRSRVAKETKT